MQFTIIVNLKDNEFLLNEKNHANWTTSLTEFQNPMDILEF